MSLIKNIWRLFWLCWIVSYVASVWQPLQYPDLWWQLNEGLHLLGGGITAIPEAMAFGFPSDNPVREYLLYELGLALVYQGCGFWGVVVALNAIPLLLVLPFARHWKAMQENSGIILALSSSLVLLFMTVRFQQRPEVPALVLQFYLGWLLFARGRNRLAPRIFYPLLTVIIAAWCNIHSSFILGLGMCGFWGLEQWIRERTRERFKSLVLSGAVSLAGVCLNPDGIYRILLPFQHQTDIWASAITKEMWSAPLSFSICFVLMVVCAVLVLFKSCRQNTPYWLLLMILASLAMTLGAVRYVGVMGCYLLLAFDASFSSLAKGNSAHPARPRDMATAAAALVVVLLLLYLRLGSLGGDRWPVEKRGLAGDAQDAVRTEGRAPLFCLSDMCAGSYGERPDLPPVYGLIDTGLARFDPETLEYYYFLNYHPAAAAYAMQHLEVDHVVVYQRNKQLASVALRGESGWKGRQVLRGQLLFDKEGQDQFAAQPVAFAELIGHMPPGADRFFYGLGRVDPQESFASLKSGLGELLSEPSQMFVMEWLQGQDLGLLSSWRDEAKQEGNQLLEWALVLASGNNEELRPFLEVTIDRWSDSPAKILAASTCLRLGERERAREILSWYQPHNKISVLKDSLLAESGQPGEHRFAWNAERSAWFMEMTDRLNRRIRELKKADHE